LPRRKRRPIVSEKQTWRKCPQRNNRLVGPEVCKECEEINFCSVGKVERRVKVQGMI